MSATSIETYLDTRLEKMIIIQKPGHMQTAPSEAECTSFMYLYRAPRVFFGSGVSIR